MRKENHCEVCGKFSYSLICGLCGKCNRILKAKNKKKYTPKRSTMCRKCGRPCAGKYCRACSQDMLNPLWQKTRKFGHYIGMCKICFKEIRGKQGTFVPGLGSAHVSCNEDREATNQRIHELEGI